MHSNLWRGDKYESEPDALENIIGHAYKVVNTPFDELPSALKASTPDVTVHSSDTFCFANALALCVGNNVAAGNVMADRYRYENVPISECVSACEANGVKFTVVPTSFGKSSNKQRKTGVKAFVEQHGQNKGVVIFNDHALFVQPAVKLDFSILKWNHVNVLLHEHSDGDSETAWL
jgi:hypothetical protein